MIRNTYLRKVERLLRRLDDEIEMLAHKSEKASAEAREVYDEQIVILRAKAAAVRNRIREVSEAAAGRWGEYKKGVEFALEDLRRAINNAVARVKRTGSDGR